MTEAEELELLELEAKAAGASKTRGAGSGKSLHGKGSIYSAGIGSDILEGITKGAPRALVQGGTLGFADEGAGAVGAGIDALKKGSVQDVVKDYIANRDKYRRDDEEARRGNPAAYSGLEFAGNVATAAVPFLNIAKYGAKARPLVSGALSGVNALGSSNADTVEGLAKDTAIGAAVGTIAQPAMEHVVAPLAAAGMRKVGALADRTGYRLNNVFLNVPEAETANYMARADEINAQRPLEHVYDEVNDVIRGKRDAVATTKDALGTARDAQRDLVVDTKMGLQADRMEAGHAAAEARGELGRAHTQTLEAIKQGTAHPVDMVPEAKNAVSVLKQMALDAEEGATAHLDDPSITVSLSDLIDQIDDVKRSYAMGPQENVFMGANKQAASELDTWKKDLLQLQGDETFGDKMAKSAQRDVPTELTDQLVNSEVSGPEARRILKALNRQIKFLEDAGGFQTPGSQALSQVRGRLRETLASKSDKYREAMAEEVAPMFALLDKANKYFGTDASAAGSLNNIISPTNRHKRETLSHLGMAVGLDFDGVVKGHEKAQGLLSSPTARMGIKEALPEAAEHAQAIEQAQTLRNPGFAKAHVEDVVTQSPELIALQQAEAAHAQAQAAMDPYSGLDSGTIQNALKSAETGKSIPKTRQIEQLGQETGKDYAQEMRNLRTQHVLSTGRPQGSRMVRLGAAVGSGLAGLATGGSIPMMSAGATMGAVAGGTVDKYGGPIAKGAMDVVLLTRKLQKSPLTQKFVGALQQAASRGQASLATTTFLLSQTEPEFNKAINSPED